MFDSLSNPIAHLIDGLIAGSALLTVGIVIAGFVRQPVNRLRTLELILGATFFTTIVALLPGLPGWNFLPTANNSSISLFDTGVAGSADQFVASREAVPSSSSSSAVGMVSQVQPIDEAIVWDVVTTLGKIAAWTYVIGLVGIFSWWIAGMVLLARIVREAEEASEDFQSVMQGIAGKTHRVRIVISDRARQPVAFRLSDRIIVIPRRLADETRTDQIHHVLAHEWSHIERGDWWTWLLANLVRAVFFFHPAAWWIRQQVRLTQDYVADSRAADQSDSRFDYAEFLTQQAAVARQPVLAVGLGMRGRKSELYRRVVSLVKSPSPIATECTKGLTIGLLLPVLALALVLGSMNVFSAGQLAEASEYSDAPLVLDTQAIAEQRDRFNFDVLTEGELQVQFEDNDESLCFQLTAVGDISDGNRRWWEPNGRLLTKSPRQATEINIASPNSRAFLLHMWKSERVSVRWRIPETTSRLIHQESIQIGERKLITSVLATDFNLETLTTKPSAGRMWLGYAAGPWHHFDTNPHPDCSIKLRRRNELGGTRLILSGPLSDHEIRVTATDREGHEEVIEVQATDEQDEITVPIVGIDERNIDCLRLSVRRFKWIQFRGIALRPSHRTQPLAIRNR